MNSINFIIYFLGIICLYCGWNVIVRKDTMQSWFSLLFVFLFSGVLFLALGVEFIAIIWLIVYFGAIAVLFLFIIMMLTLQRKAKMSINFENKLAFIFSAGLIVLMLSSILNSGQNWILTLFFNSSSSSDIVNLNKLFDSLWVSTTIDSGNFESIFNLENGINSNSFFYGNDVAVYSHLLYDTFGQCVILSGMLLFIAMIGAVFLTKKASNKTRYNN